MRSLQDILAISVERKGSEEAILDGITPPRSAEALRACPDDRWLAAMTRSIFNAGFNWKVVDSMWPGFETAFRGFDPAACAMMDDAWFDSLVTDTSIVRHGPKIRAVQENAVYLQTQADTHGGYGAFIAGWPPDRFADLLAHLKAEGTRLGGATGQYFLRSMGVDGFILSRDVVARLIAEGVIDKPPTSKSAMQAVQAAFSAWHRSSGRPLTEISRILATSIG
ncbi:DNA-3-methyladenine glycosylase I [Roseobacter sinensis]|uniref:DNA-3-methyladenine glycosylase I n=1 Tax=Roseobacter sinensis TaxID=2931391 RepID=A0ABT3BHI6_9RHOB|nr:DNA-3-methyladenine glycosylase I [Roseobacter sp. WL0113]MCV3273041.1 DNA-3-methyladenine glycosylase I [Roseobacter sp. WL0113]